VPPTTTTTTTTVPPKPDEPIDQGPAIVSVQSSRLVDTRWTGATIDGRMSRLGKRSSGSVLQVPVTGRGGIASGSKAVMLTVTAIDPSASGYITVYPCGARRPNTASLNLVRGRTSVNGVYSSVGVAGSVCVYTTSSTHLLLSAEAFVPGASPVTAFVPGRIADSRASGATADRRFRAVGKRPAGSTWPVVVQGRAGVDADAGAVMVNVTTVNAEQSGAVTVYPCGPVRPASPSFQFSSGTTNARFLVTGVGSNGRICIHTTARTHIVVDVFGAAPVNVPMRALSPLRGAY
jgi:hypothetical protein